MSKMREAFKRFCETDAAGPTGNYEFDLFSAGYQAAIADVKASGPACIGFNSTDGKTAPVMWIGNYPRVGEKLYHLPEDK